MKVAAILLCAALAACAAPKPAPVNTAKAIDAIQAFAVQVNADWRSGDPTRVAAHYARDAVVMMPGAPPMIGQEAVRAAAQKMMADPAFTLTSANDRVKVAASGDLAVVRGHFRITVTDEATKAPVTRIGSYVTVFRPQPDGSWKAVWDIVTPGPGPAPAQ